MKSSWIFAICALGCLDHNKRDRENEIDLKMTNDAITKKYALLLELTVLDPKLFLVE